MMNNKTFDDIEIRSLINPDQGAGDNTAQVSDIIDLANRTSCTLVIQTGTIADADATFTVLVEDGDASDLSDNAAVADAYLSGTEAGATPLFSDDNSAFKIGYIGPKRYVRLTITPAANTGAWDIAGCVLLGGARVKPHSTQQVV